jgi:ribosome maturation factor RimP
MSRDTSQLQEWIEPLVSALGCELWGIEMLSQGKHSLLRIYIDKETGIGVEDCESVSRHVSAVLDVEDPITGEYTLEVSSPGADRQLFKLAHYGDYSGEDVNIKLRFPYEGRRKYRGRLKSIEGEEIVVEVENHEYLFPFDSIEKANIIPHF